MAKTIRSDRSLPRPAQRNRGLALISVLWVVVLLSAIAAAILHTGRTDSQLARNLVDATQAEALANGAIEVALAGLITPVADGGWQRDGATYGWRVADGEIRVRITDEAGRIDLNAAEAELLAALFQAAGEAPEDARRLAAAIIDFRDADHLTEPGGAEDADYAAAGASHGSRDAPFAIVDELQQVRGISAALFREISPALTVYSGNPIPDNAAAPPLVRAALEIEDPEFGVDLLPPEEQAAGFALPINSALPALLSGSATPIVTSTEDGPLLIRAEAQLDNGARFTREAVAIPVPDTPAAPFLILEWRRGMALTP